MRRFAKEPKILGVRIMIEERYRPVAGWNCMAVAGLAVVGFVQPSHADAIQSGDGGGPLLAQASSAPPTGSSQPQAAGTTGASSGEELQEVTVTAERRTADLQKTAVAVSVREGQELTEQGRFSTAQILEDVPSVSFETTPVGSSANDTPANTIAIRGIMANRDVSGSFSAVVPAAAYYVDGVLNGIGGTYDINEVQVLRGPQGTLYGRSATAGAVIINTGNPVLGQFGGNAVVELGDYALQHYSAAVNLAAGDTVALRISGNTYNRSGFYASEGGKVDTNDGRVKLLFQPNSNISVLLGFAAQDNRERSGQYTGHLTGPGTGAVAYNLPTPIGTGYDQTRQYWAQVDWNLGPVTLTYMPALRDYTQHAISYTVPAAGASIKTNLSVPSDPFHTEELRLASNSTGPFQWQTGAFYYNNNFHIQDYGVLVLPPIFPPPGIVLYAAQPERRLTESVGAFAESTYSFASNTRLTTGLRGDYTKISTQQISCSGPFTTPLNCTFDLSGAQGTRIWHNLTYKLRVEQDLTPSNLLYASVSSAFLPGDVAVTTGTSGAPVAAPYEPETLTAGEIGSKNRFLDNRLQLNGDVFYYRYGGHQTPVVIGQLGGPGGPPLYVTMNSPARMVGAELEVLFQATTADRFGLNVSYTDGYYVDKPAQFAAGVANTHMSAVIPWQVDPSYQHVFSLPRDQMLTFKAEALYRSSLLAADYGSTTAANYWSLVPYLENGSTLQGNFSLTYNFLRQASLTAYVRNVSNVVYKTQVTFTSSNATQNAAQLSEPRTFGAVLSVHF
jgi:outer membrane receptor protein involved in Fe transport